MRIAFKVLTIVVLIVTTATAITKIVLSIPEEKQTEYISPELTLSDESTQSNSTEEKRVAQEPSVVWIDPSRETCIKHKGTYDKNGTCDAYSETVDQICKASGGRAPSLSDFRLLVKECGGDLTLLDGLKGRVEEMKKNRKNEAYQSCYQSKGFKGGNTRYFTNTEHSANDSNLIYVYFEDGLFDWYDSWKGYVRCIRE